MELELHTAENYYVVLGIQLGSLEEQQVPLNAQPSLQPLPVWLLLFSEKEQRSHFSGF